MQIALKKKITHMCNWCRWIVLNKDVGGQDLQDYVRTQSVQKGKKHMSGKHFAAHMNNVVLPEVIKRGDAKGLPTKIQENGISVRTARFWLHYNYMGCYFKQVCVC